MTSTNGKVFFSITRIFWRQTGSETFSLILLSKKHFATHRYDRQNGRKQHVLTASGLTGWGFQKPDDSSYENLFRLALDLEIPYKEIQELYKRMVFNLVFANIDNHLINHSFIHNDETDK